MWGDGGTINGIEFIGATSTTGIHAPIGRLIDQKDQWINVVFNIPAEVAAGNIKPFAGLTANGTLDTTSGTLEHLALTPTSPANIGPYVIYLDDFELLEPTVPGDVNGDGCVDDADLANVIFEFGGAESGSFGNTDLNDDGIVDDADLAEVIFNFGSGC